MGKHEQVKSTLCILVDACKLMSFKSKDKACRLQVVAVGEQSATFGVPGVADYCFFMKVGQLFCNVETFRTPGACAMRRRSSTALAALLVVASSDNTMCVLYGVSIHLASRGLQIVSPCLIIINLLTLRPNP